MLIGATFLIRMSFDLARATQSSEYQFYVRPLEVKRELLIARGVLITIAVPIVTAVAIVIA